MIHPTLFTLTLTCNKVCRILNIAIFTILLFFTSCNEDENTPKNCSCSAKESVNFNDVPGIVVNTAEGFFFLSPYQGYYKPCNEIDAVFLIDGLMVTLGGINKATCDKPDDIYKEQKQNYSVVGDIVIPTDSLFNNPPYEIHIIKSEDYGYPPGFGYSIIDMQTGFKILQPIIPGVAGLKPFKTTTDAFKTAVLVAYKLHLEIGLPSLTIQDLRFLQVLY